MAEDERKLELDLQRNREFISQLESDVAALKESTAILDNVRVTSCWICTFSLLYRQEAEGQQKKVLELRHYLREAAQEINHLRDALSAGGGATKLNSSGSLHFNATSAHIYGESSQRTPQQLQRTSSNISMISSGSAANSPNPNYAAKLKRSDLSGKSSLNFDAVLQQEEQEYKGGSAQSVASNNHRSVGALTLHRVGSVGGGGLNTPSRGGLSIVAPVNWLHIFRVDVQKAIDDGRCREITLKECRETMERVYESKAVANDKAMQGVGNLPMETLEMHTYRTMEKKYGLRNLAVEHVGMLLRALERYCDEDNEVSVFLRIFRNEVEEDFRLIQQELSKSIRELAMVQLMGKYPTKDQGTLHAMLEQRVGAGLINEDEWRDMVNYLYNPTDSSAICTMLRRQAADLLESSRSQEDSMVSAALPTASGVPAHSSFVIGTSGTPSNQFAENHGVLGYDKRSQRDVKRLGYSSPTLKINMRSASSSAVKVKKELLKLPFPAFVRTILDFQLRSHQQFLAPFLKVFRELDRDVDGVLNAAEFKECYLQLRRAYDGEEQYLDQEGGSVRKAAVDMAELTNSFVSLIKLLDPHESDRIIYSSAVTMLNKLNSAH